MIRALTNNPCIGVTPATISIDNNRVLARITREPMTRADWTTHDYNVHFLIGITNEGDAAQKVEICVEGGEFNELPDAVPLLYSATSFDGPWEIGDLESRTDGKLRYAIKVTLPANSKFLVANTLPRTLLSIDTEIDTLCAEADTRPEIYGTSLEGRPLRAISFGDEDGTPVVITSGFHPPEPDTLATLAIIKWLGSDEGQAALKGFRLTIVPVANPDGYANSTQGCNAAGINMYWHFAREHPDICPEASALWQLANKAQPRGYIDFHCYTLQAHKSPGPYIRPIRYYSEQLVRTASNQLRQDLTKNKKLAVVDTFPAFAPHTLGSMLATKFQTITLAKYHLHLKEGVEETRQHGIYVLQQMLRTLKNNEIAGPATTYPRHAKRLLSSSLEFWFGFLRPQFGLMRRGKFRAMKFSRTDLISP
jgi:hypothetical protein